MALALPLSLSSSSSSLLYRFMRSGIVAQCSIGAAPCHTGLGGRTTQYTGDVVSVVIVVIVCTVDVVAVAVVTPQPCSAPTTNISYPQQPFTTHAMLSHSPPLSDILSHHELPSAILNHTQQPSATFRNTRPPSAILDHLREAAAILSNPRPYSAIVKWLQPSLATLHYLHELQPHSTTFNHSELLSDPYHLLTTILFIFVQHHSS